MAEDPLPWHPHGGLYSSSGGAAQDSSAADADSVQFLTDTAAAYDCLFSGAAAGEDPAIVERRARSLGGTASTSSTDDDRSAHVLFLSPSVLVLSGNHKPACACQCSHQL